LSVTGAATRVDVALDVKTTVTETSAAAVLGAFGTAATVV
jgi:hypothetical protein